MRSSWCRCSRGFWHDGVWFDVFPTRHHAPDTSFGLALRGALRLDRRHASDSGNARAATPAHGELVAHDCALAGNPSHTGVDDLEREYPKELRARLVLYHYGSGRRWRCAARAAAIASRGAAKSSRCACAAHARARAGGGRLMGHAIPLVLTTAPRDVRGRAAARPAHLGHRPLQFPLSVLHAGRPVSAR